MTHSLDASLAVISGSYLPIYRRVTYSLDACSAILVSGSNLLNSWRVTHILDVFQFTSLVNGKPHSHFIQSYQFALQKKQLLCFTEFSHECHIHTANIP